MTTLFLYTFFVGFGLTMVSALLGTVDAGLDHGHGHGGGADGGGVDAGHAHGHVSTVSPVNFQTLVAFLMGFGGFGYMATRFGLLGLIVALPLAGVGGFGTAWLIHRFLRFLVRGGLPMEPTAWEGIVGRLTISIREGGTGEMVYSQHGARMVTAARSADGTALGKGQEVLVLRYDRGVAYVQPWRGMDEEQGRSSS